ncbi:MAG: nucleotidyltransferase domain-containing protein, partial [archaeon]|nr:nucleotidyltransferase domain-containing protein [archaeon]
MNNKTTTAKNNEEKKPQTQKPIQKTENKARPDKKNRNIKDKKAKENTPISESQKKRLETAQIFAKEVQAEFKKSLKVVTVYGSTAKGRHKETSDIDTFVVIDDTKLEQDIPLEVKERIGADLRRIAAKIDKNITIQAFMFLTEFWESIRTVEPLIMEILRFGIPVYDIGIFMPAKRMLQRGMLPTTNEAVAKRMHIAPQHLKMAEYRVKSSAHFMEQAMAAAGQAPLMFIGKVPPGKEDVPKELKFHFVEKKLLDEKYVDMAEKIHKFEKTLEYSDEKVIKNIGKRVDEHIKMTEEFIKEMQELLKRLSEQRVDNVLMNTYKAFLKANVGALELKGIKPPEHLKDLPKVMAKQFPDMQQEQEDLFERLAKAPI